MPARVFNRGVPPQGIRTFLILFALALAIPLLGLAVFAFDRMATLEQAETERRVMQVAQDLAGDIDRDLDRATATLETLATSAALKRGDFPAFHAQAVLALRRTKAAIVLIDSTYQQLVDTLKEYGAPLPPTADPETAKRVFDTKERQVSDLFRGSSTGKTAGAPGYRVNSNHARARLALWYDSARNAPLASAVFRLVRVVVSSFMNNERAARNV